MTPLMHRAGAFTDSDQVLASLYAAPHTGAAGYLPRYLTRITVTLSLPPLSQAVLISA